VLRDPMQLTWVAVHPSVEAIEPIRRALTKRYLVFVTLLADNKVSATYH